MTRIKINARRVFNLLIPFLFFISVHTKQTAAPPKSVTVEVKNETFAPQHPDQCLSRKVASEQLERIDALAEDPWLAILQAEYSFSRDYSKPHGRAFAVTDMRKTLRTGAPKNAEDGPLPTACWSCKNPDVAHLIQKDGGGGYLHGKWARGGPEIVNNSGCAGCHNTVLPESAEGKPELTPFHPYTARAMEAIGKLSERTGRLDQQSMVCGQCHVKYYFDGKNKVTKFPWDNDMKVENMEQHYDKITFSNWTNSLSKMPMLKAQHPEYETWTAGIHGRNNTTCTDCHMPKVRNAEGKLYIDYKISNPFGNLTQTCANCHTQDKAALQKVITECRQSINDLRIRIEDQLVHAHFEAKAALDAGATETKMKPIQDDIRYAQQCWDLAIAPHDIHMHAPEEGLRMLGTAIDRAADARTKLTRLLTTKDIAHEVQIPDILTKEKVQQATGLNTEQIETEKRDFIKMVIPRWEEQVHENGLLSQ